MAYPPVNPLVTALAKGEPDAYAELYDQLGQSMLRVAQVILRSVSEAEDVVQDVFMELVRHRDRLRLVVDLHAYVFSMLRHSALRRLRLRETEIHHTSQLVPKQEDHQPEMCQSNDLAKALQSLPTEQREVIALKIDGGLTFAQIAAVLDLNANTAASRYRYAIEKLRQILE